MKKYLLIILSTLILKVSFSQNVVGSIGAGSNSHNIRIYLKPDITNGAAVFSTLQFTVGLPAAITPIPALTIVSTAFGAAPAGVWVVETPYIENGFIVYPIYTAASGFTLPITANTEFVAMELAFSGGPNGFYPNAAHTICLPDGGVIGGNAYFFCSGTLNTNGSNLFYARDGNVTVSNGFSYHPVTSSGPLGNFTSFAQLIPAVTLPVNITNYEVMCNDKGALVKWTTTNEQNSDRFEIQRSTNSIDWVVIDNVAAAGNSDAQRNYQYFDLKGGAAFYRIRQVDKDGRFVYSAIKQTNCKVSQFDVTLYPVPAKDILTVVIKSDQAVRTDLQIVDINGRIVNRTVTQINKGNNNIILNVSQLPGGEYMLTSSDPSIIINRKFTVLR
jgi:Secretion system C-terminal sorting domain